MPTIFISHMKKGKAAGPNPTPVEMEECLGESGLYWLTRLFDIICRVAKLA